MRAVPWAERVASGRGRLIRLAGCPSLSRAEMRSLPFLGRSSLDIGIHFLKGMEYKG
jgi:hypothetical protein